MKISSVNPSFREAWNSFLENQSGSCFLQSWEMGNFYESLNKTIWRFALLDGEEVKGVCLLVKIVSKFSTYLYSPGGPVGEWDNFDELTDQLEKITTSEKASFVRFEPRTAKPDLTKAKKLLKAPLFTQPQCSLLLDLDKGLEEIKKNFSESTRYNIGWVERQGVSVSISSRVEEIDFFNNLLEETALRHSFTLNNQEDYYKKQYLAFQKENKAKLFITRAPEEMGREVLASAIVVYFGDTVTYLHAASSSKYPKLRAPYLMQWKIIEDAKKAGFKWYDFWGVAKDENRKDPWAGVTAFKTSFGGERVFYEKPLDLPTSINYHLNRQIEKWRKNIKFLVTR